MIHALKTLQSCVRAWINVHPAGSKPHDEVLWKPRTQGHYLFWWISSVTSCLAIDCTDPAH